jgi:hypothetical protein
MAATRVVIIVGDLVEQNVDAIDNAANNTTEVRFVLFEEAAKMPFAAAFGSVFPRDSGADR